MVGHELLRTGDNYFLLLFLPLTLGHLDAV
jgi:hypothetical protein